MADKATGSTGTTATGAPRKRRAASGPRKVKPFFVVYNVQDSGGNVIEGATLKVTSMTKNAEDIISALQSNPGMKFLKVEDTTAAAAAKNGSASAS